MPSYPSSATAGFPLKASIAGRSRHFQCGLPAMSPTREERPEAPAVCTSGRATRPLQVRCVDNACRVVPADELSVGGRLAISTVGDISSPFDDKCGRGVRIERTERRPTGAILIAPSSGRDGGLAKRSPYGGHPPAACCIRAQNQVANGNDCAFVGVDFHVRRHCRVERLNSG